MDRDISFTETLNLALAAAFAVPDLARRVTTEEWQELLDGSDWDADGILAKKKREILDAISDQRSTAVSPDAESESEASAAVEEPSLPIALAAAAEAPAAPVESDQAPDPDVTWEEPAHAAAMAYPFDIETQSVPEPVSTFEFVAPSEAPAPMDSEVTWDEPAFTPTMPGSLDVAPPETPETASSFNFGSLAEDYGALPEVQENPAPLVSWEEVPGTRTAPETIRLETPAPLDEHEASPSMFDSPDSPFFMAQPPVIDPDWIMPGQPSEATSDELRAEQPENELTRSPAEGDLEVYDDLARALEEAAAAYEQTLNSDES